MNKIRLGLLSALLAVPVLFGCDTSTPATAISTVIPTDIGGAAMATASALPADISGAATAVAPTVNAAATAVTTAVNGAVTGADAAYLNQVNDLAKQMQNSPELTGAIKAMTDAATTGAAGGTVDTAALTDSLNKAATFMNGIAGKATALTPSATTESVQAGLMQAVTDWQNGLKAAQSAAGAQNWTDCRQRRRPDDARYDRSHRADVRPHGARDQVAAESLIRRPGRACPCGRDRVLLCLVLQHGIWTSPPATAREQCCQTSRSRRIMPALRPVANHAGPWVIA